MRKLAIVAVALVLGAVGGTALAQNVKAFGGGGGPTSFKSATSGNWVKEYWVKAY